MIAFRQFVFGSMIPVNLLLIGWVWLGRGLFGATLGWIAVFMTFTVVPLLFITLAASMGLAFAQPRRPVRLTAPQAWLQVGLWAILLAIGAVVVDVDDVSHEESILINLAGWSGDLLWVSMTVTKLLAVAALSCWTVLVGMLVAGFDKRRSGAPLAR